MGDMRINKKGYPIAIGICIVAIILAFLFQNDYYLVIMLQIGSYYVASLGLNFITGLSGQPNMGVSGIFALGAYTSALVSAKLGWSPFLAIIPVLIVGWIIGKVLGFPTLRLDGVYLALTSMLFAEVIRIVIMNLTDFTGGAAGLKNIPHYRIFGIELSEYRYIVIMFALISLLMSYLAYRIIRSRWGRAFIAVRDNVEAVGTCGINVASVKIIAFTVCCLFICVAGSMYAHYLTYLTPAAFTGLLSSSFVVILIIGGIGTVSGTFAGTIFVVLLPELLRFIGDYYMIVYIAIVLFSILFFPGGIIPTFGRMKSSFTSHDLIRSFFSTGRKGDRDNG